MTMTITEKKKMGRPTVADKGQVIGVRVKTPHHKEIMRIAKKRGVRPGSLLRMIAEEWVARQSE